MAHNPADRVFSDDYKKNAEMMDAELGTGKSFDLKARDISAGGRRCRLYFVNGFIKDAVCERVIAHLMAADGEKMRACESVEQFIAVASIPIRSALTRSTFPAPSLTPRQKLPPPITMPICAPRSMHFLTLSHTELTKSNSYPLPFFPARASPLILIR